MKNDGQKRESRALTLSENVKATLVQRFGAFTLGNLHALLVDAPPNDGVVLRLRPDEVRGLIRQFDALAAKVHEEWGRTNNPDAS